MNTDEPLYVNLKVLSKLQPYQRLNTRHTLFQVTPVETNNRLTEYFTHMPEWLRRWLEGSTRDSDFNRIRDLVYKSFKTMERKSDRQKIITHLKEAIGGLNNLKKTYENDLTYMARITTLVDDIKEHVGNHVEEVLEDDNSDFFD